MKKRNIFVIFIGVIFLIVGLLLTIIQTRFFANKLVENTKKYLPIDIGVDGNFSELNIKLLPPGIVLVNPSVVLKPGNPVGLPAGTKVEAKTIDVTFQLFQLLTGSININALVINGAELKLDLDEQFLNQQEKKLNEKPKKRSSSFFSFGDKQKLDWSSLVKFNFRSIGLIDSRIDVSFLEKDKSGNFIDRKRLQTFAKELTIGKSTVSDLLSYDLLMDLQNSKLEMNGKSQDISQLQASFSISSKGVEIRNLGVQEKELNLHFNGDIKGNVFEPLKLKADIDYIVKAPIEQLLQIGYLQKIQGVSKLASSTKGNLAIEGGAKFDMANLPTSIQTQGKLKVEQLQFEEWDAKEIRFSYKWNDPSLELDSLFFKLDDGELEAAAFRLNRGTEEQEIDTTLKFRNLNFRKAMGSLLKNIYPLHMMINGETKIKAKIGKKITLDAAANLSVTDFAFKTGKYGSGKPQETLFDIPKVDLVSSFRINNEGFLLDSAEVSLPQTKLNAKGSVTTKQGFNLAVNGDVNLDDIGNFGAFPLAGKGKLFWTIKGMLPDIALSFDVDAEKASYLNLNLGSVKGKIVYKDLNDTVYLENLRAVVGRTNLAANGLVNVGKTDEIQIRVEASQGTIQDLSTIFEKMIAESIPWYPKEIYGVFNGIATVSGKTDLDSLSIMGDYHVQNVDYNGELFHSGSVRAGLDKRAYIAEKIKLRKRNGSILGDIRFSKDDELTFDFKTEKFTTLDIDRISSLGIPYRASLDFQTKGKGKIGNIQSTTSLNVGSGSIKSLAIPPSSLFVKTDESKLTAELDGLSKQVTSSLNYSWKNGSNSTFEFKLNHLNLKPLFSLLNPSLADDSSFVGGIEAGAKVKFLTGQASKSTGEFAVEKFSLSKGEYSAVLESPVKFNLQSGDYLFQGVKILTPSQTLEIDGRVDKGKITYKIAGGTDLSIFTLLTPEIVSFLGVAKIEGSLSGNAESPSFIGDIFVDKADLRLKSVEQPFERLKAELFIRDWKATLKQATAEFAGGGAKANGTALLYITKVPEIDFNIEIDNSKVKFYPVTYARTSGKVRAQGSTLPYKVTGNLYITESLIKEKFSLSEGSRLLKSSKYLPVKNTSSSGSLHMFDLNINLNADNNVFVKNDLFDAELRGKLKVINSFETPGLLGDVSVLHGKLIFKNSFFVVQNGIITFDNPSQLDPEIEFSGQTEIKGYKISILASGRVSDYKLSFQSQPPLSQNDIVNLLTLGAISSDLQNISSINRAAYSRDEMYSLIFSQSGVNQGIKDKLGVSVSVDQSQSLVPENVFRAKNVQASENISPKVVLQKEITKNLNATFGTTVGVGEATERNLGLEYGISKNMSVQGVYQDQNGPQLRQSRTSVGADLKFKVRFK